MEKDYFVTWGLGSGLVCASVERLAYPTHEEPKGTALQELVVESVAARMQYENPDSLNIYSVCELPCATWCQGQTREVVVGGRYASLEAGAGGWRIHL